MAVVAVVERLVRFNSKVLLLAVVAVAVAAEPGWQTLLGVAGGQATSANRVVLAAVVQTAAQGVGHLGALG